MTATHPRTLIVTGASGHLGRRVVELLLAAGERRVVALTRTPERLTDLAARGVEVRAADFDDPARLDRAFAGGERLLIVSTDALDRPGRRREQHLAAVAAAVRAGVRHVVYTSLTNPSPDSAVPIAGDHVATEAALADSSLSFTILRNNLYTDFILGNLRQAAATGSLFAAAGAGGVGYVTREDCARAAAAALASDRTDRATLEVTGPAVVTHAELARLVGELVGRPVAYRPVEAAAHATALRDAGIPAVFADLLVAFDVATARGELAVTSDAVTSLTLTPPMSVRDFLTAHRDALL